MGTEDDAAPIEPTPLEPSSSIGAGGADSSPAELDAGSEQTSVDGGPRHSSADAGASFGGQSGAGGSAGAGGMTGEASSAGDAGTPEDACEGGKVVHFVYFVEADESYSESQHADIERQAYAFQAYWYEQLGVTFYLNRPVVDVIEAEHESAWYVETPDGIHSDARWYRLGNVKNEVYAKLGIQDFDADHRVVSYPTTRYDGRVGGNFGGAWMDGDDLTCMPDNGPTYPYDDLNPAHCLGHAAHEFGHLLGLDHEGPNDDCMQYGFYTATVPGMCDFSAANVEKILANPDNDGWFEALPGETCEGR